MGEHIGSPLQNNLESGEHVGSILQNNHIISNVGADLRVCPFTINTGEHLGSPLQNKRFFIKFILSVTFSLSH